MQTQQVLCSQRKTMLREHTYYHYTGVDKYRKLPKSTKIYQKLPRAYYSSFLPRDALLSAVYAVVVCLSVCLCVCVCHTPVLYQNG